MREADGRPTVLICGMVHFAWEHDVQTYDVGDVTGDKRTQEIEELVARLARFRTTQVALEILELHEHAAVNERYRRYLAGDLELERAESEQVGFRLARRLGHREVHPVDWMGSIPGQRAFGEVMDWAREHEPLLYGELWGEGGGRHDVAERPLIDLIREHNTTACDAEGQRHHLRLAQIGQGEDYVGIDWLMWWYRRNLILFKNITDLARQPEDRVIMIVGAGHRFLLNQFLADSGRYRVEDALSYLA